MLGDMESQAKACVRVHSRSETPIDAFIIKIHDLGSGVIRGPH